MAPPAMGLPLPPEQHPWELPYKTEKIKAIIKTTLILQYKIAHTGERKTGSAGDDYFFGCEIIAVANP